MPASRSRRTNASTPPAAPPQRPLWPLLLLGVLIGKVLLGLGDPDAVYEQQPSVSNMGQRGRNQIWEYRTYNLQLVFYDQSGYGRWRLTNSSDLAFTATWRRHVQ